MASNGDLTIQSRAFERTNSWLNHQKPYFPGLDLIERSHITLTNFKYRDDQKRELCLKIRLMRGAKEEKQKRE